MDFNVNFLRFEFLIFLISFGYAVFFLYQKIYSLYQKIKAIFHPEVRTKVDSSKKLVMDIENKIYKNLDKYSANTLSIEDKRKIRELLKRIKINIARGEYDLAKNLIVGGLVIDKFNKELNLELAGLYILEKDYLKAEYIYKDLLLVHNNDFDILKKLAYILTMQNNFDLAIEMYKKAYEIDTSDLDVVDMLANLYHNGGEYLISIDYIKKNLKERPRDVESLFLMSDCLLKIGKIKDSLIYLKKILKIEPYNEDAINAISSIENI